MRYFIRFSYDGSKFFGFQRLNDKPSVQKKLEEALSILNKGPVEIKGAGRTDVGVHAMGQCAHFNMDVTIPEERLLQALNRLVEPYIYVFECKRVNEDFHARFSVQKKKYVYKIYKGEFNPFLYDYYLFYDNELNIEKLKGCANLFIGEHNFKNFVSGNRENSNGTIYEVQIVEKPNEVDIVLVGKSFYRYMVRNIVGAMLDYNEDKCDIMLIKRMIDDVDFNYTLRCAKAMGLYLEEVYYE